MFIYYTTVHLDVRHWLKYTNFEGLVFVHNTEKSFFWPYNRKKKHQTTLRGAIEETRCV